MSERQTSAESLVDGCHDEGLVCADSLPTQPDLPLGLQGEPAGKALLRLREKMAARQADTATSRSPKADLPATETDSPRPKWQIHRGRRPPKDAPVAPRAATRAEKGLDGAVVATTMADLESLVNRNGLEARELDLGLPVYPTTLTRLPLFRPVKRQAALRRHNHDVWEPLISAFDGGGVYRFGPVLTTYDEDTLIGLITLRQMAIRGPSNLLPVPIADLPTPSGYDRQGWHAVHVGTCLLSQLETAIRGRAPAGGWGGRDLSERRVSLDRLLLTTLKFSRPYKADGFSNIPIQLLSLASIDFERETVFLVQFHPLLSQWLESYRTFISLKLRRKLSPIGKALHRFLASQSYNRHLYERELAKILDEIGAHGSISECKRNLYLQLDRLVEESFLENWEIVGTGRRVPFVLRVWFMRRGANG